MNFLVDVICGSPRWLLASRRRSDIYKGQTQGHRSRPLPFPFLPYF